MQLRRATRGPVRAAWRMMRGGFGDGGLARGAVLIGLGMAVAVLVSCSGDSSGSSRPANLEVSETTAATARTEEPAPATGDERNGQARRTTAPGQASLPPEPSAAPGNEAAEPAGPGSIHETVEPEPGVIADPVGIAEVAEFGNGVRARLGAIESIEAEGHLPGEHSGPAVAVSVEVTNGSSRAIDLGTVSVDLTTGDGLPAYGVVVPDRPPLAGDLPAGETTSGEYVFTLAPEERTDVQVRIKYSADTPTVVFEGSIADG